MTTATQLDGGPRHGRSKVIGQVPYVRTHVSHCAFQRCRLGGSVSAGCPGGRLTQVMEGEARRGGEAVKDQMQQRRAGQGKGVGMQWQ